MNKQIRDIARKRTEQVWNKGSPLSLSYDSLSCELCHKDVKEAVCLSVGYSWRSGWVFLCDKCYYSANYWDEDETTLKAKYQKYVVQSISNADTIEKNQL